MKLIISGLLLVVSIISVPVLITPPLFADHFYLTNNTNKKVEITPFAQFKGSPSIMTLPLLAGIYPSIPSPFVSDLNIEPNEMKEIWFDSDGMWLLGIIVRDNAGQYKVMSVESVIDENSFAITDTTKFEKADASMIELTKNNQYGRFTFWLLFILIGLLNIPYYISLIIKQTRSRHLQTRS